MGLNVRPLGRWVGRVALATTAFAAALTHSDITGEWYGLYLLEDPEHLGLTLQDDLLFGQGSRLVAGMSFAAARAVASAGDRMRDGGPYLEAVWNEELGRGIVRNHFADGSELDTYLSRFENGGADGGARRGVFVGGSIPDVAASVSLSNLSGMAFRTRSGLWRHVWCNANEAMWDVARSGEIDTWQYAYLGSRVLAHDTRHFVVRSTHLVTVAGVPLRMRRVAQFVAGQPFMILDVSLRNVGVEAARYMFLYGDEPWVGQFGTSEGNLGWTMEGVFADETIVDSRDVRAAGIVDTKTGTANFLAWLGENPPDLAYVSNEMGEIRPGTPLASNAIFIGTEWRDRVIAPGEEQRMRLAIGMAERGRNGRLGVPSALLEQPARAPRGLTATASASAPRGDGRARPRRPAPRGAPRGGPPRRRPPPRAPRRR